MKPFLRSFSFVILLAGLIGAGTGAVAAADANAVAPATPGSTSMPAPAPHSPPETENGYLKLGFERLASFVFVPPAFEATAEEKSAGPTGDEQIPANVKSWDGKKVVITGYMMPVKMEKGLVTEFLVMRNTIACCYGGVPNANEWVIVKMKKGGVPVMVDVPMTFYGELKVGARFENGYLAGIYQLDCERMGEAKG
jgi:hypothetical protein